MKKIAFELVDEQKRVPLNESRLKKIVAAILRDAGYDSGAMEIAVIDNGAIHELNVEFLGHDYPTDVLSFEMERDEKEGRLEGNVIVSSEMAADRAAEFGLSPSEELMLYIIHGTLHLAGFDDHAPEDIAVMREKERHYLGLFPASEGEK